MKKHKKGFLLFELLISSVIICIMGIILSRTFSKEIELASTLKQYDKVSFFAFNKLKEIEVGLILLDDKEISNKQLATGTFENKKWNCFLTKEDKNTYSLKFIMRQIKGERDYTLNKLIVFNHL